ncbi:hypothetical protein SAMN02787148_102209 [Burkholderia vietnamiensis]|nr:hypothetical protein EC918_103136 [Burkholderia vietnamiensis]SCZ21174.1 hypothetical protein SAMN02787148_102209 [Burkholderia vietnamiensis]SFX13185.1 hypothetical protein SAMN02787160_102135 [Burkholderia vietnamiensis]
MHNGCICYVGREPSVTNTSTAFAAEHAVDLHEAMAFICRIRGHWGVRKNGPWIFRAANTRCLRSVNK